MLHSVKQLRGWELAAQDGDIGHVHEVYFDDHRWVIRHLVVDTGGWLDGRQVLISPHAVKALDPAKRRIEVALTRQQVRDAPGAEVDRPVSRQDEMASYDFHGYPYYWAGTGLWGTMALPLGGALAAESVAEVAAAASIAPEPPETASADPNLRSSHEVIGYHVAAQDGEIGHVHDFLFDPSSWQIDMVVVDTHNWLPDRLVLVPPVWVDSVDWGGRRALFKLDRASIEASPPYEEQGGVDFAGRKRVQRHFEGWI